MPSSNPLSYPPTQPLQFMRSVAVHPEWDVPTGASRRGGHQEKEQRQRKEQKGNFRNRMSMAFSFRHSPPIAPSAAFLVPENIAKAPRSPLHLFNLTANRRMSSYTSEPTSSGGLSSFNILRLRRSNLPNLAPFHRGNMPSVPEGRFAVPRSRDSRQGPTRQSSSGIPPVKAPLLEGLGIDVEDSPKLKQEAHEAAKSSSPPRIPTPSPRLDGHAYFNLGVIPALTYSPLPVESEFFAPPHPDVRTRDRPTASRPTSTLKKPRNSSGRLSIALASELPSSRSGGASCSSSLARSDGSSRPTSSHAGSGAEAELPEQAPPVPLKSSKRDRTAVLKRSSQYGPKDGEATRRSMSLDTPPTSRRSSQHSSRRNTLLDPELTRKPLPVLNVKRYSGLLVTSRPTVSMETQTPSWGIIPLPLTLRERRLQADAQRMTVASSYQRHHSELPPQPQSMGGSPTSYYPPSPSVYSVRSIGWPHLALPSKANSLYDGDADAYGDETRPETPVTFMTVSRRTTPPPAVTTIPVLISNPSNPPHVESTASFQDPVPDVRPMTPTSPSRSFDFEHRAPSPVGEQTSTSHDRPFSRMSTLGIPRDSTPPPPPRSNAATPTPESWTAAAVQADAVEESASALAAQTHRRRPFLPSVDEDSPALPTPAVPAPPVPSFLRARLAPDFFEGGVARPQRRASQPDLLGGAKERHLLTRAEKGRSFFLVQALNNPTQAPKDKIESHFYDSAEEVDSEDEEEESEEEDGSVSVCEVR